MGGPMEASLALFTTEVNRGAGSECGITSDFLLYIISYVMFCNHINVFHICVIE